MFYSGGIDERRRWGWEVDALGVEHPHRVVPLNESYSL